MTEITIAKVNSSEYEKLYESISQNRKKKADELKTQSAKEQSVFASSLLNSDWIVDIAEDGKPFYRNHPEVRFNLSHSNRRAMCITSDKDVGCDVELIKEESFFENNLKIAKKYFTVDEVKYIEESENRQKAFYSIWTMKESYIKTTGKGLRIPLGSFSVIEGVKGYIIKNILIEPEYMYAYCIKSEEDEEIQVFRRA